MNSKNCRGKYFSKCSCLFFLAAKHSLRGTELNHISTQLLLFSITERLYLLIALKFRLDFSQQETYSLLLRDSYKHRLKRKALTS